MDKNEDILTEQDLDYITWSLENTNAVPSHEVALNLVRYIQAQRTQLDGLYLEYDETQRVIRECLKEIDQRTPEEETPRLMFIRNMLLARVNKGG